MGMFIHAKCSKCWDPLPCDCGNDHPNASITVRVDIDSLTTAVTRGVQMGIEQARREAEGKD